MRPWVGEIRQLEDGYAHLPYRGEDGRAVLRAEPCACGTWAVRLSGETDPDAIDRHNATPEHQLWRGPAAGPTTGPSPVDSSGDPPARPAGGGHPG